MKKQTNPSIKAHLLWSALILLALVAVCEIPFALGQRQAVKPSVINPAAKIDAAANKYMQQVTQRAEGAVSDQILPNPKLPQVVLYDQYDNASPNHTRSTTFTDLPTFSSDLADDFVVPGGQTWNVQSIDADGGTSRALDLPPIGMFSFTPTAVLFLALKFSARSTSRSR